MHKQYTQLSFCPLNVCVRIFYFNFETSAKFLKSFKTHGFKIIFGGYDRGEKKKKWTDRQTDKVIN